MTDFRRKWQQRPAANPIPPYNPTSAPMPIMRDATFNSFGGNQAAEQSPVPALAAQGRSPVEVPFDINEQLRRGQEFQQAQGYAPDGEQNAQPTNNYPDSPEVTPDQRDPRQQAWDNYLGVLQSRPRKEKAWKEAVFLGLQALDKVFSDRPNPEPIRLLRDVQQDKRIAEAGRTLSAVEAKQKAEQDAAYRKAQTEAIPERIKVERDKILARAKADKDRFDNQWKLLEKRQKFEGNQWTREIDDEGYVYKKYKDGRMEPFEINGEQVRDPSKIFYDTVSPVTGLPIKVSGAEIFRGESAQLAKNVGIANEDIEDENKRKVELGTVESQIAGNKARMDALSSSNATLRGEIANLNPAGVYGDAEKARALQQQITAQEKEFFDLQGKTKELETQKGKLSQPLQKRKTIGTPVPKSKDPLGIFQ